MNPSSNDAFGSFSSSAGIFSGSGDGVQNTMGVNDAPVIAGGSSTSPSGGKKKWWAFLIVVLVFVAVGGMVFALWKGGVFGGNKNNSGTSASEEEIRVSFDKYANYIILGKDDNDALTRQVIEDTVPYFESLKSSGEISQYVAQANEKYNNFATVYYGDSGNDNLYIIKTYYQDFPMIKVLSETEILEAYLKAGENATDELIDETYGAIGTSQYLNGYLDALKNYAEMWLGTFVKIKNAGCIDVEGCYEMPEEDEKELAEGITKVNAVREKMQIDAKNALLEVYDEIYNDGDLE